MGKLRVGIIGATGMVGQRFITLLQNHPWFEVTLVAASPKSAGKKYSEAVNGRWKMAEAIPPGVAGLTVFDAGDVKAVTGHADFIFCALDMPKQEIQDLENAYATADIPVVSNNSAHRWTEDVPMIIPEVNPHHIRMIDYQRENRGRKKGFIVVKPNCSIQSYVLPLAPLMQFEPNRLVISTYQAISGSGLMLEEAGHIHGNTIPLPGEEEKSESEPLKIFGLTKEQLAISAHCERVPAQDGHLATVSVGFEKQVTSGQILECWKNWQPEPQKLNLPSACNPVLLYNEEKDRPQTRLDVNAGKGMAITIGRLRECPVLDFKFVALSHNTIRGAAGGAILTAEMLCEEGYIKAV